MRREAHPGMRVQPVARRQGLGVDHVERRQGNPSVVEGGEQGVLVDQGTPGDVDQVRPGLHVASVAVVEEVRRSRRWPARRPRRGRSGRATRRGQDRRLLPVCGRDDRCGGSPRTSMSKASARRATAVPMAPRPTTRASCPSRPPSDAAFHARRRFANPGLGQMLLEGQHGGQHELGDRRSARAPRAGERGPAASASKGKPSTPAPRTWTQRIPTARRPDRAAASSMRVTSTSARRRPRRPPPRRTSTPASIRGARPGPRHRPSRRGRR